MKIGICAQKRNQPQRQLQPKTQFKENYSLNRANKAAISEKILNEKRSFCQANLSMAMMGSA